MKVKTLDGREIQWSYLKYNKKNENCSDAHKKAREVIRQVYKTYQILEEVGVPISQDSFLYFDFFIPQICLIVEVQGGQHYKYVKFFHTDVLGFIRQKKNDKLKREFCVLNNIDLLELPYGQSTKWKYLVENYGN